MVTATVLICCEAGKHPAVLEGLKKIEGVKKAFPVLGRWDIVAQVEAKDLRALGQTCLRLARSLGTRAVETLIEFVE